VAQIRLIGAIANALYLSSSSAQENAAVDLLRSYEYKAIKVK